MRTHAQRLTQCVLALHERGLVHCDLKTSHFLRFSGEWRLVDFDNVIADGTECVPACTARYAAPEVAQARLSGKPLHVTSAVDVWALALVLFELFAGAPLLAEAEGTLAEIAQHPLRLVEKLRDEQRLIAEPQRRLLLDLMQVAPEARGREHPRPPSGASAAPDASGGDGGSPGPVLAAGAPSSRPALREVLLRSFFTTGEDTEEARQVEVLALFSSPRRFKTGARIEPLELMREILLLQEGVPRRLREIRPAARFPDDIIDVLRAISPRVVQFSGHGDAVTRGLFSGALAFDLGDGTIDLPDPRLFIKLLAQPSMPRLEAVFLNGCRTLDLGTTGERSLGERIVEALPHLTVIGWRSVVADKAAMAFSRGFYDALGRGCAAGAAAGKVSAPPPPRMARPLAVPRRPLPLSALCARAGEHRRGLLGRRGRLQARGLQPRRPDQGGAQRARLLRHAGGAAPPGRVGRGRVRSAAGRKALRSRIAINDDTAQ